jgi:hypothetical protein
MHERRDFNTLPDYPQCSAGFGRRYMLPSTVSTALNMRGLAVGAGDDRLVLPTRVRK